MTKVTIDIRNIASSTHADDRVIFRSPINRTGGAGLVSTANEVVTLTDGVGEVELIPGPVIVTFQCKGVTDTTAKRGVVPDTGPAALHDIISGSFSYSPEVVTATQAARDGAVEAAGQAQDYRDQTKTYRDQAASSAGLAASSLSGAQDLAADVSDDVAQANSSRDQAVQAASDASTSASQAATARDQAVQAATDTSGALDAALATKADKVHEHTTAQVTGLDTALAGKAEASTLDTRVPENLALRLDTTVGTRIFAGDTMIYGDTGWRDFRSLATDVETTRLEFRRIGNQVHISMTIPVLSSTSWTPFPTGTVPTGFRYRANQIDLTVPVSDYRGDPVGALQTLGGGSGLRYGSKTPTTSQRAYVTYISNDPWPSSLPGTPA